MEMFRIGGFYCSGATVPSVRNHIDPDMPVELVAAASGFPIGVGRAKSQKCMALGGLALVFAALGTPLLPLPYEEALRYLRGILSVVILAVFALKIIFRFPAHRGISQNTHPMQRATGRDRGAHAAQRLYQAIYQGLRAYCAQDDDHQAVP